MIRVAIRPLPAGAVLHIEGMGGWATFDLTMVQLALLREQADAAMRPRPLCPTVAAMVAQFGKGEPK